MNRASSILGGLAVIAIAVVFVVNFQPGGGQNQAKSGPACAADVLGNCITSGQYWATWRLRFHNQEPRDDAARAQKEVLDSLVERELLLGEARRLGISVSDAELTKELTAGRIRFSVPAAMLAKQASGPAAMMKLRHPIHTVVPMADEFLDKKTNKFSVEEYKRTITNTTHLSEEEFRDFQKNEIIAERMRDIIMSRVRVSEAEAYDAYTIDETTERVKFVKFRQEFYVRAVDRTKAAMDAWAEKNSADIDKAFASYKEKLGDGCREVSKIDIYLKPGTKDDEKKAAKAKLEDLKKHIAKGTVSFADAARSQSQDPIAGPESGRIGCIMKDELIGPTQPLAEPIFEAKTEGTVSDVIETQIGVHLVRVDKILTGTAAEKSLRERVVRQLYLGNESKRLAAEAGQEVQAAVKGGKSIEDALKAHLDKVPKLPAFKLDLPALPQEPPKKVELPKQDGDKGDKPKEEGEKKKGEGEKKKGDQKADGDKAPKGDKKKPDEPEKKPEDEGDKPKPVEPTPAESPSNDTDPLAPTVETSRAFTSNEEPFPDAEMGESPAGVAFALDKVGDVADHLVPIKGGGLALMVLSEKTLPSEEDWKKEKAAKIDTLRMKRQLEALVDYMKRLRAAHTAEIKANDEFFPKPKGSAGSPSAAPPPPPPEEE